MINKQRGRLSLGDFPEPHIQDEIFELSELIKSEFGEVELAADGAPVILPAHEDGCFKSVMSKDGAYAALLSSTSAFIGRALKTAKLKPALQPRKARDDKEEAFDLNLSVADDSTEIRGEERRAILGKRKNSISYTADDAEGDRCNIEMMAHAMLGDTQKAGYSQMINRAIINLCELHSTQALRGLPYSMSARSYVIVLCGFQPTPWENSAREVAKLRYVNGKEASDQISLTLIDLTKARGVADEALKDMSKTRDMSPLEAWTVFFALAHIPKYKPLLDKISEKSEGIKMAREALYEVSQSSAEREAFLSRRRAERDRDHREAMTVLIAMRKVEPQIRRLEAENADIKAENADIKAENADIKARFVSAEAENADIKARFVSAEAENADIKAKFAVLQKQVDILLSQRT
jgi:hypothetical protein